MSDDTFAVAGQTYRTARMNAFAQANVLRKLAPIVAGFGNLSQMAQAARGPEGGLEVLAAADLGPGLEALARLPDADVEAIMNASLATVSRKVEGDRGWQKVMTAPGVFMFDDIDGAVMLQIVWNVLKENLEGFFSSFRRSLPK
jgi:hypothetical protein